MKNSILLAIDLAKTHFQVCKLLPDDTEHSNKQIGRAALTKLLSTHKPESCIIFCNTKKRVKQLEELIKREGFITKSLHGDLEQKDRNQVLVQFLNKSVTVLIATDVASRGIDVNNLDLVLNFDLPFDRSVYTHRIGRTGRAGNTGVSIVLINRKEKSKIASIERKIKQTFELKPIPTGDEVCHKQILHLKILLN